jgi:hypothetical protein
VLGNNGNGSTESTLSKDKGDVEPNDAGASGTSDFDY